MSKMKAQLILEGDASQLQEQLKAESYRSALYDIKSALENKKYANNHYLADVCDLAELEDASRNAVLRALLAIMSRNNLTT